MQIPRKQQSRYTLGELADGLDKKLRQFLKVEHIDDTEVILREVLLFPLINSATADTWIRNQVGAHFSPDAAGISDNTIQTFGAKVIKFADAIICSHCNQIPSRNKSGSYWECGGGCGRTRLYPLAAPQTTVQIKS